MNKLISGDLLPIDFSYIFYWSVLRDILLAKDRSDGQFQAEAWTLAVAAWTVLIAGGLAIVLGLLAWFVWRRPLSCVARWLWRLSVVAACTGLAVTLVTPLPAVAWGLLAGGLGILAAETTARMILCRPRPQFSLKRTFAWLLAATLVLAWAGVALRDYLAVVRAEEFIASHDEVWSLSWAPQWMGHRKAYSLEFGEPAFTPELEAAVLRFGEIESVSFWDTPDLDRWAPLIGSLPSIRTVSVVGGRSRGDLLAALGTLEHLEQVTLEGQPITNGDGRALGRLTNLTELALSGRELTAEHLRNLPILPSVKDLSLRAPNWSGDLAEVLPRFPNLEVLWIQGELPGEVLAAVPKTVRSLFLEAVVLADDDGRYLAALPRLVELGLWNTRFSDAGLAHLYSHRVVVLYLHGTQVSSQSLAQLIAMGERAQQFGLPEPHRPDDSYWLYAPIVIVDPGMFHPDEISLLKQSGWTVSEQVWLGYWLNF